MNANKIDNEIVDKLKRHNVLTSDRQQVTIKELKDIAKKPGINGYLKKSKKDLADSIINDLGIIQLEIQENKSAMKGFAKQYSIDGSISVDRPISFVSFLNIVQPQVTNLLSSICQTKVNLVLWCTIEHIEVSTGKIIKTADCPFFSKTEVILDATDVKEVYKKASDKIMEFIAQFIKNGSGWRFKSIVKFDINTATFKPLRGKSYVPLPKKLAAKNDY